MTKRKASVRPERAVAAARRDEEALLLKSAESIGRLIGALQRQLDDLSGKLPPNPRKPAARKRKSSG